MIRWRLRVHQRALAIYLATCALLSALSGAPLGYALRILGGADPRGQTELFTPGLEALALRLGEASAASVFAVASTSLVGLLVATSLRVVGRCILIDHMCVRCADALARSRGRRLLRSLWWHAVIATVQLVVFGSAMLAAGRLFGAGDVARDLARASAAIGALGVGMLLALVRDVAIVWPFVASEPRAHWAACMLRIAPRLLWAKIWRTLLCALLISAAAWSASMLASVSRPAFVLTYIGVHVLLAIRTAIELSCFTAAARITSQIGRNTNIDTQ
jgi:hypothetical protein